MPLSLAMALLVALAGGWTIDHLRVTRQLVALEARQAKAAARVSQAQIDRLQESIARGNDLESRLLSAEAARPPVQKELKHAISRHTTGQPCLPGAAVRLLNAGPGIRLDALSKAAAEPAAADGAFAADTDVGQWIADASAQYAQCRERYQTLIDFYQ